MFVRLNCLEHYIHLPDHHVNSYNLTPRKNTAECSWDKVEGEYIVRTQMAGNWQLIEQTGTSMISLHRMCVQRLNDKSKRKKKVRSSHLEYCAYSHHNAICYADAATIAVFKINQVCGLL